MEPIYYIVKSIEGDYAYLQQIQSDNVVMVAMALLPEGIIVGTKLKSFLMEYEIID